MKVGGEKRLRKRKREERGKRREERERASGCA